MRWYAIALPGFFFLSGCALEKTDFLSRKEPFGPPTAPVVKKVDEANLKTKAPKAATCIAFGDFRAQEAKYPERTSHQRQTLREEARKAYQQALTIEPGNMHALVNLARLYSQMEDYTHARETYEKAVQLHPKEGGIRFELGMLQARTKNWKPALENLRLALEQDPENRQFLNTYGFALARTGKSDESFQEFLKINEPAVAHYQVARMLAHLGEVVKAKDHLTKALAKKPDYPAAVELLQSLDAGETPPNLEGS
ncbi:MAG: tetratricopeptide repeat protein [Gemmataceae bacterium]|nr:tetratricopeptide repeat protein [Gemmataceae bacterium]